MINKDAKDLLSLLRYGLIVKPGTGALMGVNRETGITFGDPFRGSVKSNQAGSLTRAFVLRPGGG